MREVFRGDTLLLRDGAEVVLVDIDTQSGWPIVQVSPTLIVAVDPVLVQEGWNYDRVD